MAENMINLVSTHLTHPWGRPWWFDALKSLPVVIFGHFRHAWKWQSLPCSGMSTVQLCSGLNIVVGFKFFSTRLKWMFPKRFLFKEAIIVDCDEIWIDQLSSNTCFAKSNSYLSFLIELLHAKPRVPLTLALFYLDWSKEKRPHLKLAPVTFPRGHLLL